VSDCVNDEIVKHVPDIIKAKVDQIFVSKFELATEDLSEEKNLFVDLGLDSLDAIDMVIAFQNEFKIKPTNMELQAIRTLQDVYLLVAKYADLKTDHAN
jgi:acyl carrier protein